MSDLEARSDEQLVSAFRTDDDRLAFEELVRRHRGRLFQLALRMVKNEDEALEIVQETFLSAYGKLKEFRGEAQVGSWLHRIAANFALMRLRHRKVVNQVEEPLELEDGLFQSDGRFEEPPAGIWGRRADELALDAELRSQINGAVDRLPDAYRAVFLLRDIEGLSYEQIAENLETTIPAVKSRLHRARLQLREDLARYFQAREA